MSFQVHLDGTGDLAAQVYRQVREAILDGRLRPGERLPASRELARTTAVSRTTVSTAYERLLAEGFVNARVGSGTFVADSTGPAPTASALRPRTRDHGSGTSPDVVLDYDLRAGTPDPALFPMPTWRRLIGRELRTGRMHRGDAAGIVALRAAIARWLGISRSIRTTADEVVVTHGTQQALDLIGRVLLAPGDVVAVEEPGYPPARALFQSMGARVTGVPVDAEGLVVDAIPPQARLVAVTPSHQFPTGVTMSLTRRRALLAWAGRHDAAIVEDDYDSEFRFANRPLEPLRSLDTGGRVVYVGSFSKTMLPALRLGFLIAPAGLRAALVQARQITVQHGDPSTEAAMAAFLDEGLFARHLKTVTRVYAQRRTLLIDALHGELAGLLEPVPSAAGLHLSAHLRNDVPDVAARAARAGVAVQTLTDFAQSRPARNGLVIGYSSITAEHLPAALHRLARCLA
ncbi:PLP-dependent aminotransferase family protein [Actinoplanes sp. NBRC 101535]|uniref:MocR-like pyridoxine biosynthesis transcription factor PdxR n=1 Tax=Actinoplanes sp. NBRC 101535 TaxID=3032196 RepID=UPI0024A1FC13|nr:PLP-dependent aminotransferase family protein [Actinoplanes sp. NBRC 101535]GLY02164.1 GntR family transcriptional regulator [Actinoplanes sp. NBRC 101535]